MDTSTTRARGPSWTLLALVCALTACQSAYYGTMEAFGVHKRDILVDRVEEARDSQSEAREEFIDALEAFREVQSFDGGDLEGLYKKLSSHFEASEERVGQVRSRVSSVERVSKDLFKEWQKEIDQISSASLRQADEALLEETRESSAELITAMRKAEAKMEPVLVAFRDNVLFLKHNLNAKAVASLKGSLAEIESDVGSLIAEMEASIAEADAFLESMGS